MPEKPSGERTEIERGEVLNAAQVLELNRRKGAHRFIDFINPVIVGTAAIAGLTGLAYPVIENAGGRDSIPPFVAQYQVGILSSICCGMILLLSFAYDRYYDLYTRAWPTSAVGDIIDILVKLSLLAGSVLFLAQPLLLIPFVSICYLLDRIRLADLKRTLPTDHPLRKYLLKIAIPNNNRHNLLVLLSVAVYIALWRGWTQALPRVLLSNAQEIPSAATKAVAQQDAVLATLLFSIYWTARVLNKRVRRANPIFQNAGMKDSDVQLERYLEQP